MTPKGERKGGLKVDPAVEAWQKTAAPNVAADTPKQARDRERVRVKADLPVELKEAVSRAADRLETSDSQLVAFLVAYGLKELTAGDEELVEALMKGRVWAKALRFRYDLTIPDAWLEGLSE